MIFEYECLACDEVFEEVRPVAERDDPHECPHCSDICSRIISSASFIIHGASEKNGYSDHIGNMMPKHLQGKKYE